MRFEKRDLLPLALTALSLAAAAYYYSALPDVIATHFDWNGKANGCMDKFWGLAAVPLIGFFVYLLIRFLPSIATKQDYVHVKELENELYWLAVLVTALMALAQFSIIASNLGASFPLDLFNLLLAAVLFYGGWLTRRAKRNYFVGVRVPWTLADDYVWRKTNDVVGVLLMAFAVAFLAVSLFDHSLALLVLFAGIIAILAVSVAYSFTLSRSKRRGRA